MNDANGEHSCHIYSHAEHGIHHHTTAHLDHRGETPITVSVYRPAVTIRCDAGPEVTINPDQVEQLSSHFNDVDDYFDNGDPDILRQ